MRSKEDELWRKKSGKSTMSQVKSNANKTRTKYVKVCLEEQKTQNSQSHPEKEIEA